MSDPASLATLDVLTKLVPPALFTDANLLCLVICRMVNLSLEHGNSDGSCFAYVWLGMIAGPRFGDYQAGVPLRPARLSTWSRQRGLTRFQARIYLVFGNRRHALDADMSGPAAICCAAPSRRRSKIGDLTFAAYSCNNLITNLLAAGDPLAEVQREAEHGLDVRAEGAVRSRHRHHHRAARADPDAARPDADIRLLRR